MRKINWSNDAEIDYLENIEYLLARWTEREAYNFMDEVDNVLKILIEENTYFQSTKYKNIYQVPIVEQITLFYKINQNNNIELLRFWNNYQNPNRLRL